MELTQQNGKYHLVLSENEILTIISSLGAAYTEIKSEEHFKFRIGCSREELLQLANNIADAYREIHPPRVN